MVLDLFFLSTDYRGRNKFVVGRHDFFWYHWEGLSKILTGSSVS